MASAATASAAASNRGNTPTPPLLSDLDRLSPPPACAICLGQFKNKSFTDSCLHQFCFDCLLQWSKIKAECPLCKQPFKTIIHSVRSNDVYDEYIIQQPVPPSDLEITSEILYTRRFRYRTTLTLHSRESLAIRRLLDSLPTESSFNPNRNVPSNSLGPRYGTQNTIFRRRLYHQNMWARPLPDLSGRFKDCSPEIYRSDYTEITRLIPWLNRELSALLVDPTSIAYVLNRITVILTEHAILSRAFHDFIDTHIPYDADHFIHEFFSFARSPYDMIGYDQYVSYQLGSPYIIDNFVNEISSSEENNSTDSDVLVVTPEGSSTTTNQSVLSVEASSSQDNNRSLGCPVVIESIGQSDTDDSSDEVVMVMCKKPPHERTPEIVDLVASDSDAIIIDEPQSATASSSNARPSDYTPLAASLPSTSGVKLSTKRKLSWTIPSSDSDSENNLRTVVSKNAFLRNKILRKHKSVSCDSTSSDSSDRDTDSDTSNVTSNSSQKRFSRKKNIDTNLQKKSKQNVDVKHFIGSNELPDSKENHNKLLIRFSSKNQSRSSSSNSHCSTSEIKQKRKKSKHKKRSKKTLDYNIKKKHKHKSKKKRSKSREKTLLNLLERKYKGKFCDKSKVKSKSNTRSIDEECDPQPLHYWPVVDSSSSSPNPDNMKKKMLKSVVNTVSGQTDSKTNLLDLMNIAVLTGSSVLSINKNSVQSDRELSEHSNRHLCTRCTSTNADPPNLKTEDNNDLF